MRQPVYIWLLNACVIAEAVVILLCYKFRIHTSGYYQSTDYDSSTNARAAFKACSNRYFSWIVPDRSDRLDAAQRNFEEDPVRIGGSDFTKGTQVSCAVKCIHYPPEDQLSQEEKGLYFDASFTSDPTSISKSKKRFIGMTILRTMESSLNNMAARLESARAEYDIVMTSSTDSDVPVPYFSWKLYDIMKPLSPKTANHTLSSALLSNCDAQSFRYEAVSLLQQLSANYSASPPLVDVFGLCSDTKRRVKTDKGEIIRSYKFHLAFENSIENDYVTEKFFQSLVEGTVPVVIGAPNILDFAPSTNSILVITRLEEVALIADRMVQLANNKSEYNKMLKWKETGPSVAFKALIDMANVHSSCRLCIHVADRLRRREMAEAQKALKPYPKHNCECSGTFRFFIRERGQFKYIEAFLFMQDLTLKGLNKSIVHAFAHSSPSGYFPVWASERDQKGHQQTAKEHLLMISNWQARPPLYIYRIYDPSKTQSQVLFGKSAIDTDDKVEKLFLKPFQQFCIHLEVILV